MRIAVISCWKYRDAWAPFIQLFNKFWPNCPHPRFIATDECHVDFPCDWTIHVNEPGMTWCDIVAETAEETGHDEYDDPILLMQEDFLLTAPVQESLIEHALYNLIVKDAGCIRLYPCPGSDLDYGDPYFGEVSELAPYKASCQAAIWNPQYLYDIASYAKGSPADFEISGTARAWTLPQPVLAFKRDVTPWPLEYLCSAISRGKWNPDAKKLCDAHGISVDWSQREMECA